MPSFSGPDPVGRSGPIAHAPPLPVAGSVDLDLSVERLWDVFMDVPRWPDWNPCFRRTSVDGGELCPGATLRFTFNPIESHYPYRLPGSAEIVELQAGDRVTWEVTAPGFHAVHSYRFASLGENRCRFGSWEVAEGPTFRALNRFWLAHFNFVCRESLAGARSVPGVA